MSIESAMSAEVDLREVVIIDNASTDKSASNLNFCASPLKIYTNIMNLGFAAACNQGAKHATGEFILFLNPDTRLHADTLQKSLQFMLSPLACDVGICGVRLEDAAGGFTSSFSNFPTASGFFLNALGFKSKGRNKGQVLQTGSQSSMAVEVDQVIGAYFLIRSKLFTQLTGFDERFFVYFEEVDLSLRAKYAGWRSVWLPKVSAFHLGGGSSQNVKALRLFYILRSRLLYAFKHFSWIGIVVVVFVTLFLEMFSRSALAVAQRSWSGFLETCAAYRMLWGWSVDWACKRLTR